MEVLRDPLSEKTKHRLESYDIPNRRCCLGHACHALIPDERRAFALMRSTGRVLYNNEHTRLPTKVAEMLDVNTICEFKEPLLIDNGPLWSGADLNDCTDLAPKEIADILWRERKKGNIQPFKRRPR